MSMFHAEDAPEAFNARVVNKLLMRNIDYGIN